MVLYVQLVDLQFFPQALGIAGNKAHSAGGLIQQGEALHQQAVHIQLCHYAAHKELEPMQRPGIHTAQRRTALAGYVQNLVVHG